MTDSCPSNDNKLDDSRGPEHHYEPGSVSKIFSEREIEVLTLIASGLTNHAISEKLFVSENTVKWHLKNIFGKLGVNNRTSAAVAAQQKELLG